MLKHVIDLDHHQPSRYSIDITIFHIFSNLTIKNQQPAFKSSPLLIININKKREKRGCKNQHPPLNRA